MGTIQNRMWLHGSSLVSYLDIFVPGWADPKIDKSGLNVHVQVGPGWPRDSLNEDDAHDFSLLPLMRLIATGGNVDINFAGFDDCSDQLGALTSSVGCESSDKAKVLKGYKPFAKLTWAKALEENALSAVQMKFIPEGFRETRTWEFLIVLDRDFMPSWLTLDKRGLKVARKSDANACVESLGFRHEYYSPPFGMTLGLPSEAGHRFQRVWAVERQFGRAFVTTDQALPPDIWPSAVKELRARKEGRWMRPYSKDKMEWYYVTEG